MSLIFCVVRQVKCDDLLEEARHIRDLTPRQYWDELISFANDHVSPGMSRRDWAQGFGWNGHALKLMVGDGERDPDDPDYDKNHIVYQQFLRYANQKRNPRLFRGEPIRFPVLTDN